MNQRRTEATRTGNDFRVVGVHRTSGDDAVIFVHALNAANAKVKAELQGVIVTLVEALEGASSPSEVMTLTSEPAAAPSAPPTVTVTPSEPPPVLTEAKATRHAATVGSMTSEGTVAPLQPPQLAHTKSDPIDTVNPALPPSSLENETEEIDTEIGDSGGAVLDAELIEDDGPQPKCMISENRQVADGTLGAMAATIQPGIETSKIAEPTVDPSHRTNDPSKNDPEGVGGWLLLLVISMWLGPFVEAGNLGSGFRAQELKHPDLRGDSGWATLQAVSWSVLVLFSAIRIYGGWVLNSRRDRAVVTTAMLVLWISGPIGFIAATIAVQFVLSSNGTSLPVNGQLAGGFLGSCIWASIWTLYLAKSKRVRNTYGGLEIVKAAKPIPVRPTSQVDEGIEAIRANFKSSRNANDARSTTPSFSTRFATAFVWTSLACILVIGLCLLASGVIYRYRTRDTEAIASLITAVLIISGTIALPTALVIALAAVKSKKFAVIIVIAVVTALVLASIQFSGQLTHHRPNDDWSDLGAPANNPTPSQPQSLLTDEDRAGAKAPQSPLLNDADRAGAHTASGPSSAKPSRLIEVTDADYFPLKVGTKWHYRSTVGGETVAVVQTIGRTETIEGHSVAQLEVVHKGVIRTEHLGIHSNGIFRHRYSEADITPPICVLAFPIKVGATWQCDATIGREAYRVTNHVESDIVTVPAGRYSTIRVRAEGEVGTQKVRNITWYASGVGMVKQIINLGGNEVTVELEGVESPLYTVGPMDAAKSVIPATLDDADAAANRGDAYQNQGNYVEAIAAYKSSIASRPNARTYCSLGFSYSQQGMIEDALTAYREAAKLDPNGEIGELAREQIGTFILGPPPSSTRSPENTSAPR